MIRHRGKEPIPTQMSVTGRVWSESVAYGVGGFIGEAFRSLPAGAESQHDELHVGGPECKTHRPMDQTLTPASSLPVTKHAPSSENANALTER